MIECKCGTPYIVYNEDEKPVMLVAALKIKGISVLKINFCPICGDKVVEDEEV